MGGRRDVLIIADTFWGFDNALISEAQLKRTPAVRTLVWRRFRVAILNLKE